MNRTHNAHSPPRRLPARRIAAIAGVAIVISGAIVAAITLRPLDGPLAGSSGFTGMTGFGGVDRTADAQLAQFPGAGPSFDLSNATIPTDQIRAGGPPKDGIPALTDPTMVPADRAGYLRPDDRVIGYAADGEARAYPLRVLNYHEIVNDRVAGTPIAVTYCPLCDSAAIFDRRTPVGLREFGVSGLLYNSNVLMYDRGGQPESLWSQVLGAGVSGPAAGKRLTALPVELTTWRDWSERYPQTSVLSAETGHPRDYRSNPYDGYLTSPGVMFPVTSTSDRLPAKQLVLGVWVGDTSKAYPLSAFGEEPVGVSET